MARFVDRIVPSSCRFALVIYITRWNDPDFSYELLQPNFMERGSPLGTLAWPNSVSVAQDNGAQQTLYLLHPYLISQVSGICMGLHLNGINRHQAP